MSLTSSGTIFALLSHGAGANSSSPWMKSWTERLNKEFSTKSFDFPYMKAEKKRAPPKAEKLVSSYIDELQDSIKDISNSKATLLCGKSMGSRVACHTVADCQSELEKVTGSRQIGILCFGYPLVGINKSIRDEVLKRLPSTVPILCIAGTRDRMCPIDQLDTVRKQMKAPSKVHIVQDGDHSLIVTKTALRKRGQTQEDVDQEIVQAIRSFVQDYIHPSAGLETTITSKRSTRSSTKSSSKRQRKLTDMNLK